MVTNQFQDDRYILSHRRNNAEEDDRLNSQHDAIKHAILDGRLVHSSIPITHITSAIADLGCGTGIWLDDVRQTLFTDPDGVNENSVMLFGFDVNAHAFNPNPAPNIQLIEHDCTKSFDPIYVGKFDLVNMRGLAYALSAEGFSLVIDNAVQLLSQVQLSVSQECFH